MGRRIAGFKKVVLIMNYENKRKLLLKNCLNQIDEKKLSTAVKEIANANISLLYSREFLDKFTAIDKTLEEKIKEIDEEESTAICSKIEKELSKRKWVAVVRMFSYHDDNGTVRADNTFIDIINKAYDLVKKLIEIHKYEKAKRIITLIKSINITYVYDLNADEIIINNTNKYDFRNYDFNSFLDCFREIGYGFSLSQLANCDLLATLSSNKSKEETARLIKEYADVTSFDFSFVQKAMHSNKTKTLNFLYDVFEEIKEDTETYKCYFESLNQLKLDISPLLDRIYPLIGKNNEVSLALEERNRNTILKYGELFFDENKRNYRAEGFANLIFKAALDLKDKNTALKYIKKSFSINASKRKLVYIVALSDKVNFEEIANLDKEVQKKHQIYPIIGDFDDDVLDKLTNEKPLGWSYSALNTILMLMKYLVGKNSKGFFKEYLELFLTSESYSEFAVKKEYFEIYLNKINEIKIDEEKIVTVIEKMSVSRIESIVFNNYRSSYKKAAYLLLDLEILKKDIGIIKADLAQLLASCRTHPAFIREYYAAKEEIKGKVSKN